MKTLLSIYIPIHNHPGLLHYVLDSCIGVADEVVIVDGAYESMLPWFDLIGSDPAVSDAETLAIIDSYRDKLNIVYHSGLWKDEPDKHLFAFNACKNDIVLTVDSDEAFVLYPEQLELFAISGIFAGTVTEKVPVTAELSIDYPGIKKKIFNKLAQGSAPHYDYLPLLRDYSVNTAANTIYTPAIGHLCHLHALRPASDQYSRSIMYHGISGRTSKDAGDVFGEEFMSAVDSDTLKRCYMWDISMHSIHSSVEYAVVESKEYPLYDIAKSAYDDLLAFEEEETNILNIKDVDGIPVRCNYPTKLNAPALGVNNIIEFQFEDEPSKIPTVLIQHRVLRDGKICNEMINLSKVELSGNIAKAKLGTASSVEKLKTFIILNVSTGTKLYTRITRVEFSKEA